MFVLLESCGALGADNLQLLAELLYDAQRIDLMKSIGQTQKGLERAIDKNGRKLSVYRLVNYIYYTSRYPTDVEEQMFLGTQLQHSSTRLCKLNHVAYSSHIR